MNAGFEDVRVFGEMLEDLNTELLELFEEFQSSRKSNTDAISQMAIDNFAEMRDKVGDQRFLLKKKIDALLHEKYGEKWIPQYSLVTFSPHISYSEAMRMGEEQSKILDTILEIEDIERKWKDFNYDHYIF
jgi:kynurenine 3-monooxygenase